jgi:hypothetical protein
VAAARASQNAEQLHYWVLTYFARGAVSDPTAVSQALTALRHAGFDPEANNVVLAAFDNARPEAAVGSR